MTVVGQSLSSSFYRAAAADKFLSIRAVVDANDDKMTNSSVAHSPTIAASDFLKSRFRAWWMLQLRATSFE